MVLVVEDNDEIRHYLRDTLEDAYRVHTASNGRIGLQKALQLVPDLIITDVMMPEMDGMEMAKKLKSDLSTSHIPLIILTAKASSEDRTDAYEIGAESFLAKPFTARLLRSRMANLLARRQEFVEKLNAAPSQQAKAQLLAASLGEADREFMDSFDKIINDNLQNEEMDVEFMTRQVGMSYSSLYRKVKALTGLAVNTYISRYRIHRAEELMLTGRYTISEIAFMVGINSPNSFRSIFRKEFGVSPSEYLKRLEMRD